MAIRLAVIADCDGTLAKDTTSLLVRELGIDPPLFWKSVQTAVEDGWDSTLAWITHLIRESQARGRGVDRKQLVETAAKIEFHPGAIELGGVLKEYVRTLGDELRQEVRLECHVVTSGLEDMLEFSALQSRSDEIWGSLLDFDPETGRALGPKSTVSFTEKTKFIFAINKGVEKTALRRKPERVNDLVPRNARPVPFRNMIYVGDGLTDIPCYSLIEQHGGAAVGVRKEEVIEYRESIDQPRLWNYRPRWGPFHPDYREGSDLVMLLKDLLHDAAIRSARSPTAD